MKIEIKFDYETDRCPRVVLYAYDVTDQVGMQKTMQVLKKLSEAMQICRPKPKESKNDRTNTKSGAGTASGQFQNRPTSN